MFDRETNITRYQHNVLEFVFANQQRNLFFCQNEDDRQLDFLKKHPRLQFIPWSHCDQVYVQTNYTLHEDVQAGDYFLKRSDAVRKIGGTFWGFAPPHLSLMPQDSYEYWINEIMWKEKTRFSRMAESVSLITDFVFNGNFRTAGDAKYRPDQSRASMCYRSMQASTWYVGLN